MAARSELSVPLLRVPAPCDPGWARLTDSQALWRFDSAPFGTAIHRGRGVSEDGAGSGEGGNTSRGPPTAQGALSAAQRVPCPSSAWRAGRRTGGTKVAVSEQAAVIVSLTRASG